MSLSRILAALAFIGVIVIFAVYAMSTGTTPLLVSWHDSYYASQAEGFLRGQLNMADEPPPELAKLNDPYSHDERLQKNVHVLWDVSYYHGKYYLYFSAVPTILFYIPVRLITGAYPKEFLITTFCTSVAFLFFALALRRALPRPHLPLGFWIIFTGVGNGVLFSLSRITFYEVPITCAMMFLGIYAYALVRFFESGSTRSAVCTGLAVALAIACRPNLGVIVVIAAVAIFVRNRKAALGFLAPLVIVGAALMIFNYVRFDSPIDFGICYQLAESRSEGCAQCSIRNWPEVMRVVNGAMHYLFWAPRAHGAFPYLEVQQVRLDSSIAYGEPPPWRVLESVAGIIPITPLVAIGTMFAAILGLRRGALDAATRAGVTLLASGWIVLLGLSSCRWVAARFTLEFSWLMIVGAVVCVEAGLTFLEEAGIHLKPLMAAMFVLCTFSIVAGLLLPFGR